MNCRTRLSAGAKQYMKNVYRSWFSTWDRVNLCDEAIQLEHCVIALENDRDGWKKIASDRLEKIFELQAVLKKLAALANEGDICCHGK